MSTFYQLAEVFVNDGVSDLVASYEDYRLLIEFPVFVTYDCYTSKVGWLLNLFFSEDLSIVLPLMKLIYNYFFFSREY